MKLRFVILLVAVLALVTGCSCIFNLVERMLPDAAVNDLTDDIADDIEAGDLEPVDGPLLPMVAYTKDGEIWLAEDTGAPRLLTGGENDSSPQFSPDGRQLLFRREVPPVDEGLRRFELWVISVDGSGVRPLFSPDNLPGKWGRPMGSDEYIMLDRLPYQTVWLSGSRRIAFNTYLEFGYGFGVYNDLWTVDIETGLLTRLLPDGDGGAFAFSSDGAALLVADHESVSLVVADGSNRRELIHFDYVMMGHGGPGYAPQPVWSPDGFYGLVAITSADFYDYPIVGFTTLYRVNRSGDVVLIGSVPGHNLDATMSAYWLDPNTDRFWSPDRTRLAYTDDDGDLFLAAADGSGPEVYAPGTFLGWSTDGSHFAFRGRDKKAMLGSPGSHPAPISDQEAWDVKWAGPLTYIYTTGDHQSRTLCVGEVGGEHRVIDTQVDSFDVFPCCSLPGGNEVQPPANGDDEQPPPGEEVQLGDYFPGGVGSVWMFDGHGSEYASSVRTMLFREGEKAQFSVSTTATTGAAVVRVTGEAITRLIWQGEEYGGKYLLNEPAQEETILLKILELCSSS